MAHQPISQKISYKKRLTKLLGLGFMLTLSHASKYCLADNALPTLISQAKIALANGQALQAAEYYEKAASLAESPEAEIGLVTAYLQAGEFRKAVAFGNLVAAEHPDISETAAMLAYLEDREGQTGAALTLLTEELKKHPDDLALIGAQAEILIDRMAAPQAIKLLDDWLSRNGGQGDIYRLRARAAVATGMLSEVVDWRKKAMLAYQASGEQDAAKPIQTWLVGQNSTVNPVAEMQASQNDTQQGQVDTLKSKPTVSNWPAHYLPAFPLARQDNLKVANGFVVDQGRLIVTAASVVAEASETIWVRNGVGKIAKASLEKVLPEQGLAVLRLETPYPKEWSITTQSKVPNDVKFCFVMGFPITDLLESGYPLLAPGVVVRPDLGIGNLMQVTSVIGDENSASPVFSANGRFIGLTMGKQEHLKDVSDREMQFGKGNFALRAEVLQNLLPQADHSVKKNKISRKNQLENKTLSVEDLYEKVLPAVVIIVAQKK